MKSILSLLLCCLAPLGFSQQAAKSPDLNRQLAAVMASAAIDVAPQEPALTATEIALAAAEPSFTVSSRITATSTPTTVRNLILGGKRLVGVNLTDSGCAPSDPWALVRLLKRYGVNWIRLHHIDRGLKEGWWTVGQILALMDAGKAEGIRFSIDGFSKIGEVYHRRDAEGKLVYAGLDNFKRDLLAGRKEAEELYQENITRITPLLRHPAMFMACLTNETAWATTPAQGLVFWRKWAPVFRAINATLLLTDMPDAWHGRPIEWAQTTMREYDVLVFHWYGGGEDFGPSGKGSWVNETWHTSDLMWRVNEARRLDPNKPVLIQEYASYSVNPWYMENEAYLQGLAALKGFSTCMFAFATGSVTDKYAALSDPNRLLTLLYGSYLSKNSAELVQAKAGFLASPKADIQRDICRIGSYVFNFKPNVPVWARLTKVF